MGNESGKGWAKADLSGQVRVLPEFFDSVCFVPPDKSKLIFPIPTFGRLLIIAFTISAMLMSSPVGVSAQDTCTDMTDHRQVLEQGQKLLQPGERQNQPIDAGGGHYRDLSLFATVGRIVNDADTVDIWSLPPASAQTLSIDTPEEINTALASAEAFETRGEFSAAESLYNRVLAKCGQSKNANQGLFDTATAGVGLTRIFADHQNVMKHGKSDHADDSTDVASSITALQYIDGAYSGRTTRGIFLQKVVNMLRDAYDVPSTFDQMLTGLDRAEEISVKAKLCFLDFAINDRGLLSKLNAKPGDISKSQGTELLARAKTLIRKYRMATECLDMACDLDKTASKLEAQQSYDMAIKLYNESMEIKLKNCGALNPETIGQYGEIARVYAEQHRYKKAEVLYSYAREQFQKLANPGDGYVSFLECYADMLNRAHEKKKAAAILAESASYPTEHK